MAYDFGEGEEFFELFLFVDSGPYAGGGQGNFVNPSPVDFRLIAGTQDLLPKEPFYSCKEKFINCSS